MTLYEFKQELYTVRENRRELRAIMVSLKSLEDDILGSAFSGAIDYSKEKVQHMTDPDRTIINAIMSIEREKEKLTTRINNLLEENKNFEDLIREQRGEGAELIRLYFIEGMTMVEIAKRFHYHRGTCYRKWSQTIEHMWKEYEGETK